MNLGQSKKGSVVEAIANIAVGVAIAFISQIIIFGHYGIVVPLMLNAKMTAWFTGVSLLRSFVLRRIFNRATVEREQHEFDKLRG